MSVWGVIMGFMSTDDEQPRDSESTASEGPRIRRSPAFEALAAKQQAEIDAKFAKLRAVAGEASKAHTAKYAGLFTEADRIRGLNTALPQIDIANSPPFRAAAAAERTAEQLGVLVDAALGAERRETTMLRWTKAGVVLAAIAALASVIAIVVTIALS